MAAAKLDVVGMGNALVDVIAHVDDPFLIEQSLTKGAMRMVLVSQIDQEGEMRGLITTLNKQRAMFVPVSAPNEEERVYPYLWRFWRHVPELGSIAIFDRSWYGRVLVERVRGYTAAADWRRAYEEIVEFERELTEHGFAVAKFWLEVSKAQQLRRFEERNRDPRHRHAEGAGVDGKAHCRAADAEFDHQRRQDGLGGEQIDKREKGDQGNQAEAPAVCGNHAEPLRFSLLTGRHDRAPCHTSPGDRLRTHFQLLMLDCSPRSAGYIMWSSCIAGGRTSAE